MDSRQIIAQTEQFGARNYQPLPIVISRAEGVFVYDPEGRRYLDMLSAYSALNQGHRHPRVIAALKEQADRVTLTSRAFFDDRLGAFYEMLSRLTGKSAILPMNTGAEAVETAVKAARRFAYDRRGIPENQAEILVCSGNFHGRTLAAISMSSNPEYQRGFGPMAAGFHVVSYGDVQALEAALTSQTAAFLVEPIQGEAGIVIPPDGYLAQAYALCRERGILFMADEIQTGFGRTGQMFACDWEGVSPDVYILGKALGGGVFPVSAVAADREILDVFEPGSHGSTFGGNPLAAACAIAAMDVVESEELPRRSRELGEYFLDRLRKEIRSPRVTSIRGRGLFIGIELTGPARPVCEELATRGILCKETHERVIRLAPPLVIEKSELDFACETVAEVLAGRGLMQPALSKDDKTGETV